LGELWKLSLGKRLFKKRRKTSKTSNRGHWSGGMPRKGSPRKIFKNRRRRQTSGGRLAEQKIASGLSVGAHGRKERAAWGGEFGGSSGCAVWQRGRWFCFFAGFPVVSNHRGISGYGGERRGGVTRGQSPGEKLLSGLGWSRTAEGGDRNWGRGRIVAAKQEGGNRG